MVKTHPDSRFVLYSLEQIRDTAAIVLQIEDTDTHFEGGKKCCLCEIVPPACYDRKQTTESLTGEVLRLNAENRRLRTKLERLTRKLEAAK